MRKHFAEHAAVDMCNRWWALVVLSLGSLMIVLDETIVIIALPKIGADLGFSGGGLVWVVNAYLLTFAGFLLLGGRLGDMFGHRRLFLLGIALFTFASLGCGVASRQGWLICARAAQGLGGAVVSAVALSLALNLFLEPRERAKAIGVFGFVSAGGGSIALLLGGTLTSVLSWHWIFLINVPIGVAVSVFGIGLLPKDRDHAKSGGLDVAGAVTVTTSLMMALYAILNCNDPDGSSAQTLALLAIAAALLLFFLGIETRVRTPLMPLGFFHLGNLAVANIIYALLTAALLAWYCIVTLYLQIILKYSPLQVGLAFLPANQIMAAFALGLSHRLVIRFGIKSLIVIGLLFASAGLALFVLAPVDGKFVRDIFPGMLLVSIGVAMTSTPLFLAALSGIDPRDFGLASGVLGATSIMGAAFGLSVLITVAAARTNNLLASGATLLGALNSGYHFVFIICSVLMVAAASVGIMFLRTGEQRCSIRGQVPSPK